MEEYGCERKKELSLGNEKKRSKRATRLIIILAAVFLLVGAISIAVVATLNSRPFQEETVYHSSQSGNSSGTNFSDSLASIESTAPEFQEKSMNILVCGWINRNSLLMSLCW